MTIWGEDMIQVTGKFIVTVVVVALGLLLALVGTMRNVTTTKGPKERRFVTRACVGTWALFVSMLILVMFFEPPYRYVIVAIYLVIFPLTIYRWSTMHQLIRHIEEKDAKSGESKKNEDES